MDKRRAAADLAMIASGSLALALGVNLFTAPNKISAGGITSLGTIFLYLFGIKISLTNLVCNCLLFFFGGRSLGKYAVYRTAAGILLLSLFLELTSRLPPYRGDLMICAVSGGALMGVGVGLVVRRGASTGGSDFAALILKKFFPHLSLAAIIMFIDCAIVAVAGLVFKSFTVTFCSVAALYVSARITDRIVSFGDSAKMVQIFSKQNERLAADIIKNLNRGVTGIYCRGMYSGKGSLMLLCVVRPRRLPALVSLVREVDPDAFIIISDAREILGEGFKKSVSPD